MCRLNGHLRFRIKEVSRSYEALSNRQKKLYITLAEVQKKHEQKPTSSYYNLFWIACQGQKKTLHNYGRLVLTFVFDI